MPSAPRPVRPNAVLATCCLSLFLVAMDVTIVNVAIPAIRRDLGASVTGMQWAIDGYTVVVASFLMLAGSTGDRLGRRRTFQAGLALFSLGSLLCSLAPTIEALVMFRVVQALGGAMLNPVAMSIITNTFLDPKERARAIGVWGAVFGISMSIGPVLGGVLTETIGWRSIFWVNVPIGALAVVLTTRFVPESRAETARRVDPVGQLLVVLGLFTLTSTLIEAPRAGWTSLPILAGFMLSAAAIAALIAYEARRFEPLLELRFFRSIPFSSATVIAVLSFTSFSGTLFLSSLYLQEVRGLAATTAGLCLLPTALALIVCSPISGRLVGAGRSRTAMVIAGVALTAGAALLTGLTVTTRLSELVVAYGLFGAGLGMVNAAITTAAVSGMPRARAGLAAALASTSRQVGATLGVALAGSFVSRGSTQGDEFALATHPVWWLAVGCGLAVIALALAATGDRARASVAGVARFLDEPMVDGGARS